MPFDAHLIIAMLGKRNLVIGVAKAIKEHFKKHPLAIVHIKGRAKGTSAQEVIYNLEVCISFMHFLKVFYINSNLRN